MRLLLDIVQDPRRLKELMAQIDDSRRQHGADAQAAAFLTLLKGLTRYLVEDQPHGSSRLREHGARRRRALGRGDAEAARSCATGRKRWSARSTCPGGHGPDGRSAVSHFVAGSVIKERGATERLAHAFQALVPDADRQRQLLGLARRGRAPRPPARARGLWKRVEGMLTSYSDEQYVSEQYARELSARGPGRSTSKRVSDDPPERIATWLGTVGDAALRTPRSSAAPRSAAIEVEPRTLARHRRDRRRS
jgi:hypothetical protein